MALDANKQELNVEDVVFFITVRGGCKSPKIGRVLKVCPQVVKIQPNPFEYEDRVTKEKKIYIQKPLYQFHSHVVKVTPNEIEYKLETQLELPFQ